tara:strand:+ start:1137 stop:1319 length:183 start_codon:yes stop_codon:yes gene_type:complete
MEHILISIITLLFLAGSTAIICSIVFDNPASYEYQPARPKPKKLEDHLDDIIIDENLLED